MEGPENDVEPVVFLIHGTFCNLPDEKTLEVAPEDDSNLAQFKRFLRKKPMRIDGQPDDGQGWWQRGSSFWWAFQNKISEKGFILAGDEVKLRENPANLDENGQVKAHLRMFKWSSLNNERARYKAGQDLLDRLLELEKEGREYHLIGHSHGGSVIWIALWQSMIRRWKSPTYKPLLKLKHLRSWTTVGTPFFHYRPSWIGLWYGKFVTILLLIISLGVGGLVGHREYKSWAKEGNPVDVLIVEPFRNVSAWFKEKFQERESVVPINLPVGEVPGVRDRQREFRQELGIPFRPPQHKVPENFWQWIKAFVDVGLTFLIVFGPFLGAYLLARAYRIEARSVRKEFRAQNQAMLDFGGRWLGIWCTEDEAINGLRATTSLHKSKVLPRIQIPSEVVFASDRIIRFYRFFIRLFTGFVNKRLVPKADSIFLSNVAKGAQGHNRLGARLIDVTEGPVIVPGYSFPSLPSEVNQRLIDRANQAIAARAEEIVAKTRTGFSQAAWGGSELLTTVNSVSSELEGNELIHNSYFEDEFVQDVMAQHLDLVRSVPPPIPIMDDKQGNTTKGTVWKWSQKILWIVFGCFLALAFFIESAIDDAIYIKTPVYLLSASLLTTGILALVAVFRGAARLERPMVNIAILKNRREVEDPPKAMWLYLVPGLIMIFCAVFYGVIHQIFPSISKLAPQVTNFLSSDSSFAHPGFIMGVGLTLATLCFICGFSQIRKNELLSQLSLLSSVGLLIGLIWAADLIISPGWSIGLATGGALMLGIYKALDPLKSCADIISMPRNIRGEAGENKLPLEGWLFHAKQNALDSLAALRDLKVDALPNLERPNALATAWALIFAACLVMTCGMGVIALPLILLLSLAPLTRACRGARGGIMASVNFNITTFAFAAGLVSLFAWFGYDLVKVPPADTVTSGEFIDLDDGTKVLAAVFGSKQACRWNVANRDGFERLKCESTDEWDFLSTSADKQFLVGVSGNKIGIWNVAEWKLENFFDGHRGEISGIGFDPFGNLVSAATDGNLIFWDIKTGDPLTDPGGKGKPILCLDSNAGGKSIAVGLKSGELAIWDSNLKTEIARDYIHRRSVKQILYRGSDIFSIDKNGEMKRSGRVRDSAGKLRIVEKQLPKAHVGRGKRLKAVAMAHLDDENQLAVAFTNRKKKKQNEHWLSLLSREGSDEWRETRIAKLEGFNGAIRAISFSSDLEHMTVRTADKKLHIFDGAEILAEGSFQGGLSAPVNSVVFSPDGSTVASAHRDKSIWLWDVKSSSARSWLKMKSSYMHSDGIRSIAFSPDGKTLAGVFESEVGLWDVATGKSKDIDRYTSVSNTVTYHPDGNTLATAGYQSIRIWDAKTLSHREITNASPHQLAFSPDGNLLASATNGYGLRLWDIKSGEIRSTLGGSDYGAKTVAFSPDGKTIASSSYKTIKLWNIENGNADLTIDEHTDAVNGVVFSRNGTLVASCSSDRTIRVWDAKTGESRAQFNGLSTIRSIDFSPDGKMLVSGSGNGNVRLWDISTGEYKDFIPIQFMPPQPLQSKESKESLAVE